MWKIRKKETVHDWLDFEPATVLDEYDGPAIFTLNDVSGNYFLAYFVGRDQDGVRFLVVPFSDNLERRLVSGDINLREALTNPRMWIFDLNKEWNPVRCWRVTSTDLPNGLLPKPGVMLRPDMKKVMKNAIVMPITSNSTWNIRVPSHLSANLV